MNTGVPVRMGLDAAQQGQTAFLAHSEVYEDDIGPPPLQINDEMFGIQREGSLKTFEAEQHAQCFAGDRVPVHDVDQSASIQERMIVDLVAHFAPVQLASFAQIAILRPDKATPSQRCRWQRRLRRPLGESPR
jgi:hypothetical protein